MTVFEKHNIVEKAFNLDVYAIYLRKSRSDDPEESVEKTLERHKKILTDLAAKKGLYVGKIYQEVVSGAESIEGRPEIQQLIQDCYAGMYRGIIIVEITRLSRGSQGDAQKILDCLKYSNRNNGLLVVTPT
jgi:DNA invertase Pin-like site-specific DNA recombinase